MHYKKVFVFFFWGGGGKHLKECKFGEQFREEVEKSVLDNDIEDIYFFDVNTKCVENIRIFMSAQHE